MNASANTMPVTQAVANTLRSADMQRQISTMLPKGIDLDKFTEVTIAAIANSPEVLEADKDSLYRACVASARRGLLPDKKEGALVVYNTKVGKNPDRWMKLVQFLPMVEGIIKEMNKAGIKVYAVSVYEQDAISFWNDDQGQHVRHEPVVFGDRGKLVGFYASAITADGRPYVEAMNVDDTMRVAARSKQCYTDNAGVFQLGGTWKSDFDRMGQKSALHRVRKRLGITDDLEETTDIELGATTPVAADPSQAAAQPDPASPPSEQPAGQPALEHQPNPLNTTLKRPRRSRVLEGVKATMSQAAATPEPVKQTVEQPKPQGQSEPVAQEPYNEDDVI